MPEYLKALHERFTTVSPEAMRVQREQDRILTRLRGQLGKSQRILLLHLLDAGTAWSGTWTNRGAKAQILLRHIKTGDEGQNHRVHRGLQAQLTASGESRQLLRDSLSNWLRVFKFPSVERVICLALQPEVEPPLNQ